MAGLPGSVVTAPSPSRRAVRRPASRKAPDGLVAAGLVVAVVAVHLWLVSAMRAPIIMADEYGYLYDGHFLALGGPSPFDPAYPSAVYYPGYSLLLAPLWWALRSPSRVYHAALLVNCALAGVTTLLLWVLVGRLLPNLRRPGRVLVVALVSAYPAFLLFSSIAESENLAIPVVLGVMIGVEEAFRGRRPLAWAALGLGTGLAYAVHPSLLVLAVVLVPVAAWRARPLRVGGRALVAMLAGLLAGLSASAALVAWVTGRARGDGAGLVHTLAREASATGLAHVGLELAGQALYLLVGTAGLAGIGALVAWRSTWRLVRDRPGTPSSVTTEAFAGLSLAAMLVLSAVTLADGLRLDDWVYGRYAEAVLAPVLVLGLAGAGELCRRARPAVRRLRREDRLPVAAPPDGSVAARSAKARLRRERPLRPGTVALVLLGAIGAAAGVVVIGRGTVLRGTVVATNVLAIHAFVSVPEGTLDVLALGGVGAGVVLLALAAFRRGLLPGALVAFAFFLPSVLASYHDVTAQTRGTARERVVASTLVAIAKRFGPVPSCVAYDTAVDRPFNYFFDRLFDPSQRFAPFDSRTGGHPCSDEVVSGRAHLGEALPGARLVVPENDAPEALFVLPGPLQQRLAAAGWLFPAGAEDAAVPVPAQARVGTVSLRAREPRRILLAPGRAARVAVVVRNGGSGPTAAPWPDAAGTHEAYGAVNVSALWLSEARRGPARTVAFDPAAGSLPRTLLPGERASVSVELTGLGPGGRRLRPGRYLVRLGVTQDGVGPFAGVRPASLVVEVEGGRR
jgi:hypothetical protein